MIESGLEHAGSEASAESAGLPEGWTEVRLDEICSPPQYGWTTSASTTKGGLKFLRTTDISSGTVDWSTVPACQDEPDDPDKYQLRVGDIVVSRAGSVGINFLIQTCPAAIFASYLIRFRPLGSIPSEFISLYMRTPQYWESIADHTAGIALPNVNASKLGRLIIPLPPLAEQRRICAIVESLLSLVNTSRDRLSAVLQLLQRFRQSVLAAAFSGQLTADWREANPSEVSIPKLLAAREIAKRKKWEELQKTRMYEPSIRPQIDLLPDESDIPEKWAWASPHELCEVIVDCPHSTPKWTDAGEICLRTTNFRPGVLDLTAVRFVSPKTYAERIERLKPEPGDVVYSREGGILGIACVIPAGLKACLGQRMMLMRTARDICLPSFLTFVLNSPLILAIVRDQTGGTSSPHLNVGDIKAFPIPLPPVSEQHEIVSRIERLFALADRIEQRLKNASAAAERITQSVLSRAFQGELVPTEAALARREGREFEPAPTLLERIQAEREAAAARPQKNGNPRRGRKKVAK